jgi:RHS repeat-associated protein
LYGEYDNSGNLIREYVYLNSAPLGQITTGSPEFLTYLHTDHLGTPRFATNTAGTQVWSWTNDAFGTSAPSGSVTVNLRMPGQYYDSESGLFANWNRYYNPAIGRYISSDPIGIAGGLNTFGYTHANPTRRVDPFGLDTEDSDGDDAELDRELDEILREMGYEAIPEWEQVRIPSEDAIEFYNKIQDAQDNPLARRGGEGCPINPATAPKRAPNVEPLTNPPQNPPAKIPAGWRIWSNPKPSTAYPDLYPYGYWRLQKPMSNGGWQDMNPSTMKPGTGQGDTHIPYPAPNLD